jgi:hypothetical protein
MLMHTSGSHSRRLLALLLLQQGRSAAQGHCHHLLLVRSQLCLQAARWLMGSPAVMKKSRKSSSRSLQPPAAAKQQQMPSEWCPW